MGILRVQEYRKTLPDAQKCSFKAFKPQKRVITHLSKNNALERKFRCFLDFPHKIITGTFFYLPSLKP